MSQPAQATPLRAQPGQYLTFSIKNQIYGVSIQAVREINRFSHVTAVPQVPFYMAGVMNLRGKIIPVVNLNLKFGYEPPEPTKETCIIVVECLGNSIGVIVEAVSSVIELARDQIEVSPSMGHGANTEFVMGMGKLEDKVIILIDIASALGSEGVEHIVKSAAIDSDAA